MKLRKNISCGLFNFQSECCIPDMEMRSRVAAETADLISCKANEWLAVNSTSLHLIGLLQLVQQKVARRDEWGWEISRNGFSKGFRKIVVQRVTDVMRYLYNDHVISIAGTCQTSGSTSITPKVPYGSLSDLPALRTFCKMRYTEL